MIRKECFVNILCGNLHFVFVSEIESAISLRIFKNLYRIKLAHNNIEALCVAFETYIDNVLCLIQTTKFFLVNSTKIGNPNFVIVVCAKLELELLSKLFPSHHQYFCIFIMFSELLYLVGVNSKGLVLG